MLLARPFAAPAAVCSGRAAAAWRTR